MRMIGNWHSKFVLAQEEYRRDDRREEERYDEDRRRREGKAMEDRWPVCWFHVWVHGWPIWRSVKTKAGL